jgi:hypothetical protein
LFILGSFAAIATLRVLSPVSPISHPRAQRGRPFYVRQRIFGKVKSAVIS